MRQEYVCTGGPDSGPQWHWWGSAPVLPPLAPATFYVCRVMALDQLVSRAPDTGALQQWEEGTPGPGSQLCTRQCSSHARRKWVLGSSVASSTGRLPATSALQLGATSWEQWWRPSRDRAGVFPEVARGTIGVWPREGTAWAGMGAVPAQRALPPWSWGWGQERRITLKWNWGPQGDV